MKIVKIFRNDELARKYAPVLLQKSEVKPNPEELLYRMTRKDGNLLIAYHVVWPYERDEGNGFYSLLNKIFYTGIFKFQRIIYGPKDVEAIELKIDEKSGKILGIKYETAIEKKGKIIHVPVIKEFDKPLDPPLFFEVVTWNHLFRYVENGKSSDANVYKLEPKYFEERLWKYYRMTKKYKHFLSRDRAHFDWERI